MAPKRNAAAAPTPSPSVQSTSTPPAVAKSTAVKAKDGNLQPQEIAVAIWQNYLDKTPQRTKLIDVFMAFLVVVGVLQFVYCVIVGNYVWTYKLAVCLCLELIGVNSRSTLF